jgi:hypothetical protein
VSEHHCSECGEDAEVDPMSFCGDYSCCAPSYLLTCNCPGALVCFGDCADDHRTTHPKDPR